MIMCDCKTCVNEIFAEIREETEASMNPRFIELLKDSRLQGVVVGHEEGRFYADIPFGAIGYGVTLDEAIESLLAKADAEAA